MKNRTVALIACLLIVLSAGTVAVYMARSAEPPVKGTAYSEDSLEIDAEALATLAVMRARFGVYNREEGEGTVRLFTQEQAQIRQSGEDIWTQGYLAYDEVMFLINDSVRLYHEYGEIILTGERDLFVHRTSFEDVSWEESTDLRINACYGKAEQAYAQKRAQYGEMIEDIYQIILYRLMMLDRDLQKYYLEDGQKVLVLSADGKAGTSEQALTDDCNAFFGGENQNGLRAPLLFTYLGEEHAPEISLVGTDGAVTVLYPTAELASDEPTGAVSVTGLQSKTLVGADELTVCSALGAGTKEKGTHGCDADYTVSLCDQTASYCAACRVFWDGEYCYYPDYETRKALGQLLPSDTEGERTFSQYTHAENGAVRLFSREQVRALDVDWTGGDRAFVTEEELCLLIEDTVSLYETYGEIILTDGARLGFGEGTGDLHIVPYCGDYEGMLYTQASAQYEQVLTDICTIIRYRLYLLDGGVRFSLDNKEQTRGYVLLDEGTHRSTADYLDGVLALCKTADWVAEGYFMDTIRVVSMSWQERIDRANCMPWLMLETASVIRNELTDELTLGYAETFPTQAYRDKKPCDRGNAKMRAVDLHGVTHEISGEEGDYLARVVSNGAWVEGTPDCDADYVINWMSRNEPLRYHASCGVLSDRDGTHVLYLTPEQQAHLAWFLPRVSETHGQCSEPYQTFAWVSMGEGMAYPFFGTENDEALLAKWLTQGEWQSCEPREYGKNGRWYLFAFVQETVYYDRDVGAFYAGDSCDRMLQLTGEQRKYMQDKIP